MSFRLTDGNEYLFQAKDEVSFHPRQPSLLSLLWSLTWRPLQEEMSSWIQAILNTASGGQDSNLGTPPLGRAQTMPPAVTLASESSPGKREKDKEKEKRFSLFSKKKQ